MLLTISDGLNPCRDRCILSLVHFSSVLENVQRHNLVLFILRSVLRCIFNLAGMDPYLPNDVMLAEIIENRADFRSNIYTTQKSQFMFCL